MKTIGLSMIVKNEVEDLERLLASVVPMKFDELCFALTGDNPETEKLLLKHGAKVIHHKWKDDWSEARTAAYGMMTTDYVMWLDSDDTIENAGELRKLFEEISEKGISAIHLKYDYRFDSSGICTCSYFRERIVERLKYHWTGSVNETLDLLPGIEGTAVSLEEAKIHHHHPSIDQERLERNVRMAKKAYEKKDVSMKEILNYGQSLHDLGMHKEAKEILMEYVEKIDHEQGKMFGLILYYFCAKALFEWDLCEEVCDKMAKIWPLCGEPYFKKAEIAYNRMQWQRTIDLCVEGFNLCQPSHTFLPFNLLAYTLYPCRILAESLLLVGRTDESLVVSMRALQDYPTDPVLLNLSMGARDLITQRNGN